MFSVHPKLVALDSHPLDLPLQFGSLCRGSSVLWTPPFNLALRVGGSALHSRGRQQCGRGRGNGRGQEQGDGSGRRRRISVRSSLLFRCAAAFRPALPRKAAPLFPESPPCSSQTVRAALSKHFGLDQTLRHSLHRKVHLPHRT